MGGMPRLAWAQHGHNFHATGMGTARTAHIPCGGLKLAHTRDDRRDHLTGLRRWRKHPGHTLTGGGGWHPQTRDTQPGPRMRTSATGLLTPRIVAHATGLDLAWRLT